MQLARKAEGLTLIEVLVAILMIGIGLLGIAGLQTSAVTNNYLAYQSTQAVMLAESMADRMRANMTGLDSYILAAGDLPAATTNCASEQCTPDELALWDMSIWVAAISASTNTFDNIPAVQTAQLPRGWASIGCADSPCTDESIRVITVYWDPDRSGLSTFTCDPDVSTDYRCFRTTYAP